MQKTIHYDNEKYIVTIYYNGAYPFIRWQQFFIYRSERNAINRISQFLRDNFKRV